MTSASPPFFQTSDISAPKLLPAPAVSVVFALWAPFRLLSELLYTEMALPADNQWAKQGRNDHVTKKLSHA